MNFIEIKSKYDRHGEKLEKEQKIIINVDFIELIEKCDTDFDNLGNNVIPKKLFRVDIYFSYKVIYIYFPSLKERDECYDNLVKRIEQEKWIQEMKERTEEKNRENEMEEITRQIIERGQNFKDVIERGRPDKLRS